MKDKDIAGELLSHPFFADMLPATVAMIAGCGENVVFAPDTVIAAEGSAADEFYCIRKGRVALQVHTAGSSPALLQTLDDGDILGWSWLFPPYRWSVEARAVQRVRAIKLDGKCLREKCDADPALGYDLVKRFSRIMTDRLEATRLRLLDLYGEAESL